MRRRPNGTHPIYWKTSRQRPPEDWVKIPVVDYAESFKGKLPSSLLETPADDAIPYLLIDNFIKGKATTYTTDTNLPAISERDTAVVGDGSRSGLAVRGMAGILGSTLVGFRAREGFDEDYLFYVLESLVPYTNTATIGGAVPHLDQRLLGTMKLATPPLIEQRAIAKVLKTADETIDATKKEIEATERLKRSLMQQLFTEGIPGRHQRFTVKKWLSYPETWTPTKLGNISSIGSGFTMGRNLSGFETVEVPYLTVRNVRDGYFDFSDLASIEVKETELKGYSLSYGDVLMTEGGDRDKLGRGGMWREEVKPCVFQNHIFRIRFEQKTYLPELFHYLMQSYWTKNYFNAHAKQTSNLATINSRELKNFPLAIPNFDEQEDMLELMRAVEKQLISQRDELEANQRLKQSLLQNLLTGRVRVGAGVAA